MQTQSFRDVYTAYAANASLKIIENLMHLQGKQSHAKKKMKYHIKNILILLAVFGLRAGLKDPLFMRWKI